MFKRLKIQVPRAIPQPLESFFPFPFFGFLTSHRLMRIAQAIKCRKLDGRLLGRLSICGWIHRATGSTSGESTSELSTELFKPWFFSNQRGREGFSARYVGNLPEEMRVINFRMAILETEIEKSAFQSSSEHANNSRFELQPIASKKGQLEQVSEI